MKEMTSDVGVLAAARTPMGRFQGSLSGQTATDLGAAAISGVLEKAGVTTDLIDEVIMGCVLSAGLGQAPARQAAMGAGLSEHVPCSTVNKVCGSGMKAAMFATDLIRAGSAKFVVAGGMESMSNAPYLLSKARSGYRIGHGQMSDHMFLDGLEDAYDRGRAMGNFAEDAVESYKFTREEQDAYAVQSLRRAIAATESGAFHDEIVSVDGIELDEQPGKAKIEKIPTLRPAFRKDGTVTAANASSISDGAAALVLADRKTAEEAGKAPIATILGHASYAAEPCRFTTAPVFATQKLLNQLGWRVDDVDLFEVNEAFAAVAMIAMRDLNIAHDKLNVNGGACALGHPIGCSGVRILVTLISALHARGKKRGVASVCIGGGEATAMAVELA